MPKSVFAIHDTTVDSDTFVYISETAGAAQSYFVNWCLMQRHRNYSLFLVCSIDVRDETSSVYEVISLDRMKLMDMFPESQDDSIMRR